MNIGIVLNYFRYFLQFPRHDVDSSYKYITSRQKYTYENISPLQYIDWREYKAVSKTPVGDADTLFRSSMKLGLIPRGVDYHKLCAFYELSFEKFLDKQKIEMLISGGVTGFERIGIATAQRMGIKTLCVWEGMFRPYTISVDDKGMNIEASISDTPFMEITKHSKSKAFDNLWNKIDSQNRKTIDTKKELSAVLGNRFHIVGQLRSRIFDRNDIERIRLPFRQLVKSRL
jgi:hypothetical protein